MLAYYGPRKLALSGRLYFLISPLRRRATSHRRVPRRSPPGPRQSTEKERTSRANEHPSAHRTPAPPEHFREDTIERFARFDVSASVAPGEARESEADCSNI